MISFSDFFFFSFRNATLRHQGQSGRLEEHLGRLWLNLPSQLCNCFLSPGSIDVLCFHISPSSPPMYCYPLELARRPSNVLFSWFLLHDPHISSLSFPILHSVLISFSFLKARSSHAQYLVRFYIYSRALKNMVLYHYNRFSKHVAKAEKGVVVVQQSTRWGSNLHMGIRNARTRYARVPK